MTEYFVHTQTVCIPGLSQSRELGMRLVRLYMQSTTSHWGMQGGGGIRNDYM